MADGCEIDQLDAVLETVDNAGRGPQAQDASCPLRPATESQQADLLAPKALRYAGNLAVAPNQRRALDRKVLGTPFQFSRDLPFARAAPRIFALPVEDVREDQVSGCVRADARGEAALRQLTVHARNRCVLTSLSRRAVAVARVGNCVSRSAMC
jgi:hypothetical protein